jgi:hypothetical protein
MKRSGICGFQLVDVAAGSGQEVEKKINFGTPEWYHAVRHSAEEAKWLGLEMSIFSSPEWSEAGGAWVQPEQAMKKLEWSEAKIQGPVVFGSKLPQLPSNEGKTTSSSGPIDATPLLDDSLNTSVNIAAPAEGGPAWLQYEFAAPYTARAMTIGSRSRIPVGRILASDDGENFGPLW